MVGVNQPIGSNPISSSSVKADANSALMVVHNQKFHLVAYIVMLHSNIGLWCNGSISDSKSLDQGSNPCKPANIDSVV